MDFNFVLGVEHPRDDCEYRSNQGWLRICECMCVVSDTVSLFCMFPERVCSAILYGVILVNLK